MPSLSASLTRRLSTIVRRTAATLLFLVLSAGLASAAYTLQPGDRIRLTITELPTASSSTTIDADGMVHFPRFGTFQAAGRTLEDLQAAVSQAATGTIVSYYSATGERLQVALSGTEVFTEVEAYRPVYVRGDVARPGPVEFQPGLTVRAAITVAGGETLVPQFLQNSFLSTPNLQSSFQTFALRHASAVARRWMLEATIRRDLDLPVPSSSEVAIPEAAFERLLEDQRRELTLNTNRYDTNKRSLEERLAVLNERITLLTQQLDQQQEAVTLEEEDVDRVRRLQEQGLTPNARLSDARQALLLVSSRLLDVQDSLAQFTLQQKELQEQYRTFDVDYERPFVEERTQILAQIWAAQAELNGARQSLALNGASTEVFGGGDPEITITLVRTTLEEGTRTVPVGLDDLVQPADVIDVDVKYEFPSFPGTGGFDIPAPAPPVAGPAQ